MDPLTASAVASVLNQVLGGSAAEAGKSAWTGLVKLVRSAFPGHDSASAEVVAAAERLTPAIGAPGAAPDQNAVIDLSAELVSLARHDAGFESALREWLGQARSLSIGGNATVNVVSGDVYGNVIQARNISGGLN